MTMKPGVDGVDLRLFSDLSAVLQAWDLESLMTQNISTYEKFWCHVPVLQHDR